MNKYTLYGKVFRVDDGGYFILHDELKGSKYRINFTNLQKKFIDNAVERNQIISCTCYTDKKTGNRCLLSTGNYMHTKATENSRTKRIKAMAESRALESEIVRDKIKVSSNYNSSMPAVKKRRANKDGQLITNNPEKHNPTSISKRNNEIYEDQQKAFNKWKESTCDPTT